MTSYVIRRVFLGLFLLMAASVMAFGILKLAPGDYFAQLQADPRIPQSFVDEQRRMYGLDKPVIVQYVMWVNNALHGNLGISFEYKQPVTNVIWSRVANTLILNI